MKKDELVAGLLGAVGLLQITFIVIRLLDVVQWSWVWVLSPLWIPVALFLVSLCVCLIAVAFGASFTDEK